MPTEATGAALAPATSSRGSWTLHHGDALSVLKTLSDDSVHTFVTSPPYLGQRDEGHPDQIGAESTAAEYANHLADIFDECRRVGHPSATLWLNLGDAYAGSGGPGGDHNEGGIRAKVERYAGTRRQLSGDGLKPKDLVGAPWTVAFELRKRGWWLRSDNIWHKATPKPGGGHLDRPNVDHEYIFQLANSQYPFYDKFAALVPTADGKGMRNRRTVIRHRTSSYKGAHFSTFDPGLVQPLIEISTSAAGACPTCNAPWHRLIEKVGESTFTKTKRKVGFTTDQLNRIATTTGHRENKNAVTKRGTTPHLAIREMIEVGWAATCKCGADADALVPAVVCDPFAGASSTGMAALACGRDYLGIELMDKSIELSHDRLYAAYGAGTVLRHGLTHS